MKIGAVIVAAGMSSRMDSFKPMLNIGSISAAKRVISTLQQGGSEITVVVTGNHADTLEKHLAKCGVLFLRNERYAETDMFCSARIGLTYLRDKCEKVLFTPIDVPLFNAKTVCSLTGSDARIAIPKCCGEEGHPILLTREAIDKVLNFEGDLGLKGAIANANLPTEYIDVKDKGILFDMDTPEDYSSLLKWHNKQMLRPLVGLSLAREEKFFDAYCAQFLNLIRDTNSVKAACTRMKLSYSKARKLLDTIERNTGLTVVMSQQGGIEGGYTELTEEGIKLIEKFTMFESESRKVIDEMFKQYFD